MNKKSLLEEIHEWISELDHWEQYLATKILNKQKIGEPEIKKAYNYFLEDNELIKKESERTEIKIQSSTANKNADVKFYLKEIKDVKGINALKENQSIPISNHLTIIYGDNGVGKSGYIRIMNNTFLSRGDKNIIENIYSSTKPKEKSCIYKFIKDEEEYELKYPDNADNHEFFCYAVFDNKSAYAHINIEDEMQFLPNGLEFFDAFAKSVDQIKELLLGNINNNSPENIFIDHFEKDTSTKKIIENLPNSNINTVREKATLTPQELERLNELEKKLLELRKTDVSKKSKSLKFLKSQLSVLKDNFETVNDLFSEDSILEYKKLIGNYILNKELSSKEGLSQFKTDLLNNTGSAEWKNLIIAAKEFAMTQNEDEEVYPIKGDVCLLCRQPLSKEAKLLIEAYWIFLSSNAEVQLKELIREINVTSETLKELNTIFLTEESKIYEWLEESFESFLQNWIAQIKIVESLRKKLLNTLKSKQWSDEIISKQITLKPISVIEKSIDERLLSLNEAEINKKIKNTEKEIDELKDRKKLKTLLDKIEDYLNKHSWAKKAQTKIISTRKITAKQKELFILHVTDEYVKTFNSECEKLDANFGIEISQRPSKGNTLKHLVLKGRTPSTILSEGEQRAISLADFLTEIQIGNKNRGIVFDDPVNSLDHIRRQIIAERLIEEAKVRQVIIFTHDITFLLAIQTLSEEKNVECAVTTIRKINNIPGIVNSSIPWTASNVKTRIGHLNEMLQELKRLEKAGDPDKYSFAAKAWSGLLRETWERSIEEKLLNDAIQRFSPSIQTKRLEKAKFTPDLYKEVEKGMTDCSNWVHDQARTINTPTPNTAKLESFLSDFKLFVQRFKT